MTYTPLVDLNRAPGSIILTLSGNHMRHVMTERLRGKTAVVTGAGQGMGRAIAEAFADEGAHVWATSRSLGPLQGLADRPRIDIVEVDVTDPASLREAVATIGSVDVLVNCAGYVATGSILECEDEDLRRSLDVNVRGAYYAVKAFLPGMLERGGGSIINMASVVSSLAAAPERFAYGTSKAAMIGLTKSVALDFVKQGIRCNAVCPGTIATPGLEARIQESDDPEAMRAIYAARHKMGRVGTVPEIVEACIYLASDAGGFITGQPLVIDGGMTL